MQQMTDEYFLTWIYMVSRSVLLTNISSRLLGLELGHDIFLIYFVQRF